MKPAADLWALTQGQPQIDPDDLSRAIEVQIAQGELDYRTQLLIHESTEALQSYWSAERFNIWLDSSMFKERILGISNKHFDEIGFPSLSRRLMDSTKLETIKQFLQHVGISIPTNIKLEIAGSIALIAAGYLTRHTEDIDVIDELPPEIRTCHKLLEELQGSYGLHFSHVRSHYYPSGWQSRLHYFGKFERLEIFVLDAHDIFLGKLFSARLKDLEDLRVLSAKLDKATLCQGLSNSCQTFLQQAKLLEQAAKNWRIVYAEDLPLAM